MAATLANGGYCPITGYRVFQSEAVRNTLSLMYACGMYDHSGQFSFQVGKVQLPNQKTELASYSFSFRIVRNDKIAHISGCV